MPAPRTLGIQLALILFFGSSTYETASLSNRILGGFKSSMKELPYQLALEGAPNGRHVCGASVLATHWAITAAHCVYNKPLRSLRIRSGTDVRQEGGTLHPVNFYLYHDLYREDTLDYDLALVNVKVPFRFGPTVRPVFLPRTPPRGMELATVSGWGFLEKEQLQKPKNLMAADVYVVPWKECKHSHPALTPRMLCAGAADVDFCSGDSGGPLVTGNGEQIGVVSWLYKCGDGLPGVYSNVSDMLPWIVSSLRKYGVYLEGATSTSISSMEPNYFIMFPK